MKKNIIKITSIVIVILVIFGTGLYLIIDRPWKNNGESMYGIYDEIDFSEILPASCEHGRFYQSHGILFLDLNGTYEEKGYAHGLLAGMLIKYTIYFILEQLMGGNITKYEYWHDLLIPTYFVLNSTYHLKELEAIYQGSIDAQYDMFVPALNRNWDVLDLWLINSGVDTNYLYGYACSGFGIWGITSQYGKIIIGRNFDFVLDDRGYVTQLNIVLILRGTPSRNTIVLFSWPGHIACSTGFNDKGVWIGNDNIGGKITLQPNRTMLGIAYRNFLEQEDGLSVAADIQSFLLKENILDPFAAVIGTNDTSVENSVFVVEGKDDQVVIRTGGEEGLVDSVLLTNHLRKLIPPPDPEDQRIIWWKEDIANFTSSGDFVISDLEGRYMLKHANYIMPNILAAMFYPATLEFSVGIAYLDGIENGEQFMRSAMVEGVFDIRLNYIFDFKTL